MNFGLSKPIFLIVQLPRGSSRKVSGLQSTKRQAGEDKTWTRGPWTPSLDQVHGPLSWTGSMDPLSWTGSSSETQGRSVGPGEKARRKLLSTGGKAPGYRLSPDHFQKVKRMLAPDWALKRLCIILPNRRTVSPEFFS